MKPWHGCEICWRSICPQVSDAALWLSFRAADEYLAATRYYLEHASPLIAAAFVAEVETAVQTLLTSPTTWPVIEEPQIRRYLLKRFPYSLYYRWEPEVESSFYLCCHALQQTTKLLAASRDMMVGIRNGCVLKMGLLYF